VFFERLTKALLVLRALYNFSNQTAMDSAISLIKGHAVLGSLFKGLHILYRIFHQLVTLVLWILNAKFKLFLSIIL
jgi:hypothetical protein